ncbi:M20 family metallopeptidase [Thermodesulfobacteriota bacterium]
MFSFDIRHWMLNIRHSKRRLSDVDPTGAPRIGRTSPGPSPEAEGLGYNSNMEEIIHLTQNLIRFKSTQSNPQGIQQCVEFIENYLRKYRIEYRHSVYGNSPSILVLPDLQTGFAPILLMAHVDVVDAPAELFSPLVKGTKLYGRGSLDDKYAVALSLVLLKKQIQRLEQQNKGQIDLPFGILITSDEETGGFKGAKQVLQKIKTNFCIVLDGGNVKKIIVKEKGSVRIKLVCKLKADRDTRLWTEKNAIEKLTGDYNKLNTHFVKSAPEHRHRSIHLMDIHSENPFQQTPEHAAALLDIRYTENDNMEKLFDWMQSELQSEVIVESIAPLFPDGESPYLNLLLEIAKTAGIGFQDGSNDARFLSKNKINGIIFGADGNQSQHSLTEHVDIVSIYELYGILDTFIQRSEKSI